MNANRRSKLDLEPMLPEGEAYPFGRIGPTRAKRGPKVMPLGADAVNQVWDDKPECFFVSPLSENRRLSLGLNLLAIDAIALPSIPHVGRNARRFVASWATARLDDVP